MTFRHRWKISDDSYDAALVPRDTDHSGPFWQNVLLIWDTLKEHLSYFRPETCLLAQHLIGPVAAVCHILWLRLHRSPFIRFCLEYPAVKQSFVVRIIGTLRVQVTPSLQRFMVPSNTFCHYSHIVKCVRVSSVLTPEAVSCDLFSRMSCLECHRFETTHSIVSDWHVHVAAQLANPLFASRLSISDIVGDIRCVNISSFSSSLLASILLHYPGLPVFPFQATCSVGCLSCHFARKQAVLTR